MTPRWFDIPTGDWIALNAKLRGLVTALNTADATTTLGVTTSQTWTPTTPFTAMLVDTTAGNVTITLPPAADYAGYALAVKKVVAANTVTIDPDGSEQVDNLTTLAWTTQWGAYTLVSNGTQWYAVSIFGISSSTGGGGGVPFLLI